MADREWRGHWWLPDKPDEVMPGTLIRREEDGEVLLKLVGGFNITVLTPISENESGVSFDSEFPIILGNSGDQLFTLLQCTAIHTSGGFLGSHVNEQDIRVLRALRGIHLTGPHEEVFDSVVLKIEYLLGWMHATTMKAEAELSGYKWTGKQTATTAPIDDLNATSGGNDYTLSVVFNQFGFEDRPRANERSLTNREWAELTVKSPQPTKFREFDGITKGVMDLMTLVAHAPAGVIEETLWFTPSDAHPAAGRRTSIDVEVMGRQIYRPKPDSAQTGNAECLFTLDDIPFADVLPRWLDLHERTWLACSTLFGLRYIPEGYTTARLLTVATTAEAMHRGLFPAAKKLSYRERLLALAGIPDQEAVGMLIRNVPKWAKYIKEHRNGMAHGDRDQIGPDEGPLVFDALEVTVALLGLVLLHELGLSSEVQRRAASSPYLHLVVARFNQALP
jgi:ApeA N-terminal domain 1